MYQSIFLQLNVVQWNPLCWGIPLALKWGFYLAHVERYSHLKNALRATRNAWRATMGDLNVVHWTPLCWGIPLALKWGFYLAQVESYSHLKNAWRATRNAWRATMGVGNQRCGASVSTEKEVVLNLLCRRALVFRQGELAQMV